MFSGLVLLIVALVFTGGVVYFGVQASRQSVVEARRLAKAQYADEVARYAAWEAIRSSAAIDDDRPVMINPTARKAATISLIITTLAFTAFGLGLWLQPNRWALTPSYGLLLGILHQQAWGTIYLVVAALLATAIRWPRTRWLVVTAHTAGIALAGSWFLAFVVRYFSDSATTVVNVVSWGVYVSLLVQSALMLNDDDGPKPPGAQK